MPRRSQEERDPPYLRRLRAEQEIIKTARWLLSIYDTGERVPVAAWEELRTRINHADATG